MIITSARSGIYRTAAGMILLLLVLAIYPLRSAAAELTEVTVSARPELKLPDLSAQMRSLDAFRGRVLLVTFWASWCHPCIQEMPAIRRLAAAMREQPFEVIAVNVGEGERRASTAANRLEMDFTVLLDHDSAVFNRWGASVLPTAYILDRSGQIRYIGRGPQEWDGAEIIEKLTALAQQSP